MHRSKLTPFYKVGQKWLLTNARIARSVRQAHRNCPSEKPAGCATVASHSSCKPASAPQKDVLTTSTTTAATVSTSCAPCPDCPPCPQISPTPVQAVRKPRGPSIIGKLLSLVMRSGIVAGSMFLTHRLGVWKALDPKKNSFQVVADEAKSMQHDLEQLISKISKPQ